MVQQEKNDNMIHDWEDVKKELGAEEPQLTISHFQEAMDRAYVSMVHFEQFVSEHLAVRRTPELANQAQVITEKMYDFYNAISALLDKNDPETREWLDGPPRGREII
jgi:hypothetical protein